MDIIKNYNIAVGFLQTNCWILPCAEQENKTPHGFSCCIVIDPGDEADRIIALLDQYSLFPSYILLTHGHFDHIGALSEIIDEFEKRHSLRPLLGFHPEEMVKNLPKPDIFLVEGLCICHLMVLHLPGHSPGSIGLWDRQSRLLFSGDTLFNDGYGRTDLPGGNTAHLFASLRRLLSMDGKIKVFPGHGESTTIEQEKENLLPWLTNEL